MLQDIIRYLKTFRYSIYNYELKIGMLFSQNIEYIGNLNIIIEYPNE